MTTPQAAPLPRMLLSQTRFELALVLRNGEQLLLTLVIPVLLLVLLSTVPVLDLGTSNRVDVVAPGVLALAVMSTAFTSLAIATGYERRYGLLKLLRSTPLPTWGLVAAKTATVVVVEVLQLAVLVPLALLLGWTVSPGAGGLLALVGLLVLGTAAFAGLALWLAGTVRAEITLALANLVYVVLLVVGGVVVPLDQLPEPLALAASLTPTGALTEGLRAVVGDGPFGTAVLTLAAWTVLGSAAAARWFRWE